MPNKPQYFEGMSADLMVKMARSQAETYCSFIASAVFDDLIEIHTFVEEIRRCGFRLGNQIFCNKKDNNPQLLAKGYTAMVTVDNDRKPTALPQVFRETFTNLTQFTNLT